MFSDLTLDRHRYRIHLGLFVLAIVLLLPGIDQLSGITGKDEYFLSLRTPLTMMEQDRWVVPWLDQAPRLKKPPLIYWLGRASFELLGPSLFSARIISVLFAAVLVLLTALIAYALTRRRGLSLTAALVALSTMAIAVEGRRLMLDLPCATFSALAFYFFLRWREQTSIGYAGLSATALAAGFLTKGPLVAMLFGSGVAAMFLIQPALRQQLLRHYWQVVGFALCFVLLALPWFIYIYNTFPEYSTSMLEEDAKARELFSFSGAPLSALLLIIFPWSFILILALVRFKTLRQVPAGQGELFFMLVLWLVLSLLPFFFFKSFTRYMAGSLVPMAILSAFAMQHCAPKALRIAARSGMFITALLVLGFSAFAWWFHTASWGVAVMLAALIYFVVQWWRVPGPMSMALSAALLWASLLGVLYPSLGINAIPQQVIDTVGDKPVILFAGPQPAMLSIAKGRSYYRSKTLTTKDLQQRPWIFMSAEDEPRLQQQLRALGVAYIPRMRYRSMSSRSSWLKFARKGATREDWRAAFKTRSLAPIQSEIVLYAPAPGKKAKQ